MGIETSTTITGLNEAWPLGTDPRAEGDNHLRLVKDVLKRRFDDATAGELKFKSVTLLSVVSGGVVRGQFGISGSDVLMRAIDAAGAVTSMFRTRTASGDLMLDNDQTLRGLPLDGSKERWHLNWQVASGFMELAAYSPAGTKQSYLQWDSALSMASNSRTAHWNHPRAAADVYHYWWYGADAGVRFAVASANGNWFVQRTNAAATVVVNLVVLDNANGNFQVTVGDSVVSTVGKGLSVATSVGSFGRFNGTNIDGHGTGATPKNNVEIATWQGFGIVDATSSQVRWCLNARSGTTVQVGDIQFTSGVFLQASNGNIAFAADMITAVGAPNLAAALNFRATINNQTGSSATGFPLGTVLAAQMGGVSGVRNASYTLTLNSANTGLYVLAGQANAGTALDGAWRYLGLCSTGNGLFQRVG